MFALILAIIAIALVVATVIGTSYFGGGAITDGQAVAESARLRTEGQQILAGMDMFNADHQRWPVNVQELVNTGYLRTIPKGAEQASVQGSNLLELVIPPAYAAEGAIGWGTPLERQPIFWTSARVPKLVCQKYNQATRGDDGILKSPFNNLSAQCFGSEGSYQVVVGKMGPSIPALAVALAPLIVTTGWLPDATAGDNWWTSAPTGAITSPIDPDKGALPELALQGSAILGNVQIGETKKSNPITLRNTGRGAAHSIAVTVPASFSLVDSSCSSELAAGAACQFAVTFTPAAAGGYSGDIVVRASTGILLQMGASGRGAPPSAELRSVDFGDLPSGTSLIRDVTLTNTGVGTLAIQSAGVTSGAAFAKVAGGTCGSSLAASASCTYKVQLTASVGSEFTGTFSVVTEGAGTLAANMVGQVAQARFSVSPQSYDFRNVMVGFTAVGPVHTVKNYGSVAGPLSITGLPTGYTLSNSTCGATLAAGVSCSFALAFKPTAVTSYGGSVKLSSGGVEQAAISVTGSGTTQVFSISNSLAFGNVATGTQRQVNTTLRNITASPVPLPSAASMFSFSVPGFTIFYSGCGSQLTQNGSGNAACLITVAYTSPGPGPAISGFMYIDTGLGVLSVPITVTPK